MENTLFDTKTTKKGVELLTIKQASKWASDYLERTVTTSNISYLIQYGKVRKIGDNGDLFVDKHDLMQYYKSFWGRREIEWKSKLGEDLNWALSFDHLKEADTTKHVHRLHPYKGKFIPQLVEYFLDDHTDDFKKEVFFQKGDIILDPFCGSGTTLIQANELGMHAIGIDISEFNSLISNIKVGDYNFVESHNVFKNITNSLRGFIAGSNTVKFENELLIELAKFNSCYFPSPAYKYRLNRGEINEEQYAREKEKEFLPIYQRLIKKYGINLKQDKGGKFLDKWFLKHMRSEIDFAHRHIQSIQDVPTREIFSVILSRTIRSCRATTHSDLATLKEPVITTYYCTKHAKICKPLFSILAWWERYSADTLKRLAQFKNIRTKTFQTCLTGDARTIDLLRALKGKAPYLWELTRKRKIKGIFSSPPYVGLIDYHEQHAYAYDLFGFERKDKLEIGPLCKGQGRDARNSYVQDIADVLNNCAKFLTDDFDIFLVANDKYNLYSSIAEKSAMKIVNRYKRPVLNRTEKDKGAYSELIFHFKQK